MIRFLTAGESHGPLLTAVVDGLPAGLPMKASYINEQLKRRQGGYGRGGRMQIESDQVQIVSGIRGGYTLGSPVSLLIQNKDWANWETIMTAEENALLTEKVVTRPRPGHADLSGAMKYNHRDMRNVLERSSARETAARVAVGALARKLLEELQVQVVGFVQAIGSVQCASMDFPPQVLQERVNASPVYCPDVEAEKAMMETIDQAKEQGDSLGGIFEIRVFGLLPGIGGYGQWDQRLDGRLAGALMGIQAIKGVEIGLGFQGAALPGSQVHDEIYHDQQKGFYRMTNGAGGIEGGMTNGSPVVLRAAMKPIPTLYQPKQSVDIASKEVFLASVERSDVCAVPAACVVGEAVVAWELAKVCLEQFGGDTVEDLQQRWEAYGKKVSMF